MPNFDPNAILRGAQLTLVGAHRALLNPRIFKHQHYREAALAVAAGIIIHLLVSFPAVLARATIWIIGLFTNLEAATWDNKVIESLDFLQHTVLQVPFFLMNIVKYISPALDDMFMEALDWVDKTYAAKHESDDAQDLRGSYFPNLSQYTSDLPPITKSRKKNPFDGISILFIRYGKRGMMALTIYLLSYVPYVGNFILPVLSFYTLDRAIGIKPAVAIFASGLVLPKQYLIWFLQTFFSSRSMMNELLEPYFSRVHFDKQQKRSWFREREGVLFGFGAGFFILLKIPLCGVLIYGIAEASTAYLITKITDPPPPFNERKQFVESQLTWKNKANFLTLPLDKFNAGNIISSRG